MVNTTQIVEIAKANIGKTGCSVNSGGAVGYCGSCASNNETVQEQWCADFVRWVWEQVGADVTGLSAAAGSFGEYGPGLGDTPHIGDAVVFGYDGNGSADHVAIVTDISGATIRSIGGDEGYPQASLQTAFVQYDGWYSFAHGNTEFGLPLSGFVSPIGGSVPPAPAPSVPTNQEDEYQMELKTGKGAMDVMRFPVFPSYLFLFTDIGGTGGGPTTIRVAFHGTGSNWLVQEVTLTAAAPSAILPLPADAYDGVSLVRNDDGPVVAASWR